MEIPIGGHPDLFYIIDYEKRFEKDNLIKNYQAILTNNLKTNRVFLDALLIIYAKKAILLSRRYAIISPPKAPIKKPLVKLRHPLEDSSRVPSSLSENDASP